MGMVFQKTYRDKKTGERRRCNTYSIRYYRNGKQLEESTRATSKKQAEAILKKREGDIQHGLPVSPDLYRVSFEDAMLAVIRDYKDRGNRSLPDVQRRIDQQLSKAFGGIRVSAITTSKIQAYRQRREEQGAAPATINREMAILKRSFALLKRDGRVLATPHIPMARERNARQGFFSDEQFAALVSNLSQDVGDMIRFAFVTGWRIPSEVLTLRWHQVDFERGEVRLAPGTTKNDEGRTFPFTEDLQCLLEARLGVRNQLLQQGRMCPFVFHRNGAQIRDFRDEWRKACILAGVPGRIPHDLRRTAVRNFVQCGIPDVVAMRLSGHKTRCVFDRYNIVSPNDLREAASRLSAKQSTVLKTVIWRGEDGAIPANRSQQVVGGHQAISALSSLA